MELVDLGAGGAAWVRSSLRQGRSMSAAVLAGVDLPAGRTVAVVPEGTSPERAAALATGGLTSVWDAGDALEDVLAELVGAGPATLVVEDAHALATDAWVSGRHHDTVATVGDVVVHWLALPAEPGVAGRFVLRKGGGYPTNAFLVAAPPGDLGLSAMATPDGLPAAVAARTVAVVTAAYDAESVVVWWPR
jgi:hypothetical protein